MNSGEKEETKPEQVKKVRACEGKGLQRSSISARKDSEWAGSPFCEQEGSVRPEREKSEWEREGENSGEKGEEEEWESDESFSFSLSRVEEKEQRRLRGSAHPNNVYITLFREHYGYLLLELNSILPESGDYSGACPSEISCRGVWSAGEGGLKK